MTVDENREFAEDLGVTRLPTLKIFRAGGKVMLDYERPPETDAIVMEMTYQVCMHLIVHLLPRRRSRTSSGPSRARCCRSTRSASRHPSHPSPTYSSPFSRTSACQHYYARWK